jgi:hypothetical protein
VNNYQLLPQLIDFLLELKKGRCYLHHFLPHKEKNQVMKQFQNQPVSNSRQALTAADMET